VPAEASEPGACAAAGFEANAAAQSENPATKEAGRVGRCMGAQHRGEAAADP
jgi:hypothetical protein